MANFVALNVEPEEDSEEEIDDTKEIQIEEALKLYQNALKLHSQGPAFYPEADAAYDALFESEIFSYAEALSESKRTEQYGYPLVGEEKADSELLTISPAVTVKSADGTPNTLHQLLYLSYKNHGQFLLDRLIHQLEISGKLGIVLDATQPYFIQDSLATALDILDFFAEALERDDTDSELWRRTSKIAGLVGSQRIARYCLEAVLRIKGIGYPNNAEPPGMEETFAAEDLKDSINILHDELSKSRSAKLFPKSNKESNKIPPAIRKLMDACPRLPTGTYVVDLNAMPSSQAHLIPVPAKNWASVGKAILRQATMDLQGVTESGFGAGYSFAMTDGETSYLNAAIELDTAARVRHPSQIDNVGNVPPINMDPLYSSQAGRSTTLTGHDFGNKDGQESREHPNVIHAAGPGGLPNAPPHSNAQAVDESPRVDLANDGVCGSDSVTATSNTAGAVTLPTRKRTLDSTGLPEHGENGRMRSKRIRARAEVAPDEENEAAELARYYEVRLQDTVLADIWLERATNAVLSKLGAPCLVLPTEPCPSSSTLEDKMLSGASDFIPDLHTALHDFKNALERWDPNKSTLLLHRSIFDESVSNISGSSDTSFAMFLQHAQVGSQKSSSKPILDGDIGLADFLFNVNRSWASMNEIIWGWVVALLQPDGNVNGDSGSMYLDFVWPASLKETVVQILVSQDEIVITSLRLGRHQSRVIPEDTTRDNQLGDMRQLDLVQTIFELHLDIYGSITNPGSKVDESLRVIQRDRLKRWATLASLEFDHLNGFIPDQEIPKTLMLRHLWSSVIYVRLGEVVSRDHILLCFQDLKSILERAGSPVVELQNNAIMPEISVAAADREIAKLTTMDFFSSIFDPAKQDPLVIIESLEPMLMETQHIEKRLEPSGHTDRPDNPSDEERSKIPLGHETDQFPEDIVTPSMQQMTDFLDKAGASLRLFLWRRLRTAYETIDYPPMVLLCNIRSLQLVLNELRSRVYCSESPGDRAAQLVRWLGYLDDLLIKSLRLATECSSAFDCLDENNFHAAVQVCTDLIRLMHVFVLWEDATRVGQSMVPLQTTGAATTAHKSAMNQLREMHLKAWMLQYLVLKEGILQHGILFPSPVDNLTGYLRALHHALGLRGYCKLGKKAFLKFAKAELLSSKPSDDWESDMAQIVYDLYGLKVCPNGMGVVDHFCLPDNLDRPSALELVDFVMSQAQKLNVKDLLKTELKGAIDKMQGVIGAPNAKSLVFNRRVLSAYMKSPINPLEMYRSLRGIGGLFGTPIHTEHALIAQKRWYFLLGYLTFAKFRSQKHVSPSPTDDLDIAIIFFWHDLEFDAENWETWYRLAQVYDAKIEEDTKWNSDKLNGHMGDLVILQRSAIRCYMMAVAVAVRCADDSFETAAKMSELYTDFGNRVYFSSREPFSMAAFDLQDYKRYCNNNRGTYERLPFRQLHPPEAWIFASVLFRQALQDKPGLWLNWYMLGKCLWKVHSSPTKAESRAGFQEVLEAYTTAIQCVPEKRDSRHPDKDLVLEPHYKLVSIVHKLVQRGRISPEEGCRYLDVTPYASQVPHVQDIDDWDSYILPVLKSLRAADKANWHHRMVARVAHVIYDESSLDMMKMTAYAAKQELTQTIFTKTMSVQVWKPEHERAGRHFVYTRRYVTFFVKLLVQLGDRSSIEALGRRVRRKPGDFLDHSSVWSEVCMAHLKLLRQHGAIPEGHEDAVFKLVSLESFNINGNRLEDWFHLQSLSTQPNPATKLLDLLRETIELKKTNGNLMKSMLIDDLIGDVFARVYELLVPELIAKSNDAENRDRMRVDHLLMGNDVPSTDAASLLPFGQDQIPVRVRPKVVGRRDIGRKAEALVAKSVAVPSTNKTTAAISGPTSAPLGESTLAVVIERTAESTDDGLEKEVASSVSGSVHDSADDESELSDVADEEEVEKVEINPKPSMFPGLVGGSRQAEGSDMVDDEVDSDEDEASDDDDDKPKDTREESAETPVET